MFLPLLLRAPAIYIYYGQMYVSLCMYINENIEILEWTDATTKYIHGKPPDELTITSGQFTLASVYKI